MRIPGATYVARPSWDGQQWQVRVEDYDDVHRGDTTAGRLDQVGPKAAALLAAQFGCLPSHLRVSVEPELPKPIAYALQVAEDSVAAAARQVEDVATALRQGNVPGHDVAAILAERALYAAPRRPLLIPNAEIAAYGLSHRPEVVAIEWPERETVFTCCRTCVEWRSGPWQNQREGTSALVYDARGRCDLCGQDLAAPEAPTDEDER